jgi:colanic acid biosynthesis glycosyl transferase WcaI
VTADRASTDALTEPRWGELEAAYASPEPAGHPIAGKHVLIVGINYAPEPTGIAPYTTQIAEHLASFAASVTVLAGPPSYPAWRVESHHRGRHRVERRNGVEVHRLWHYVPSRQTGARRAVYEATFGAHVAQASLRLRHRPNLVFAVVPSLAGAAAAARVAKRHDVPLVLHVQDLMGRAAAQSGMSGGQRLSGAAGRLERHIALHADRIAIVSEAFRAVLQDYGVSHERIVLLPNWTHIGESSRDRNEVRAELGWAEGVTVALHSGNMGWKQDLGNVIEAARLSAQISAQGRDLLWVLMGDGSQRAALEEQAGDLVNVQFLRPCPAHDYPDVLAAADVLLVNERPSVGDMSLPSKLTSYAVANRPVVAAVPESSATSKAAGALPGAIVVPPSEPTLLVSAVMRAQSLMSSFGNSGSGRSVWTDQLRALLTFDYASVRQRR